MRQTATSLQEIKDRHNCVETVREPYEACVIARGIVEPLTELTDAIESVRKDHELVEVYIRPRGDNTVFEPLEERHFAADGEWVIVARRRHPTALPRIVGIMMAKGEADIIPNVIGNLGMSLDALYYSAGDADTAAVIKTCWPPGWAHEVAPPAGMARTDGVRQYLLERARADAAALNDPRPMWVVVAQGDEVYHDDLRHHILLAQQERATVMTCQVATFLLHESQREGWDWLQPLEKRLNHYIWDFGEHSGFLDFPWIYYTPSEHMRAHPHGIYPSKGASARPVRKHYPFRSPGQAHARIIDRLSKSAEHPHGWQPHYENYQDVFVGSSAAGREVKRYHGWFGEAERTPGGIW